MTRRRVRSVAALITAGVLATGLAVVLGAPAGAQPVPAASPHGRTVTLPTGEHVTMAGHDYAVVPGTATGPVLRYTSRDGHRHLVPGGVARYLGSAVDPALFDLDALAAKQSADGSVPVTLTFAPGATPTAPAGVTLDSVTGSTATGHLTPGPAFAAALRHGPGAGLRSIGVTGVPAARAVQPRYPLHTLEIDGVDSAGAPAEGFAVVFNTDDLTKQDMTFVSIVDGVGKVNVPAGHYTVFGDIDDVTADGRPTAMHIMAVDATVTDAPVSKLTVDERTATAKLGVTTPKPATQADTTINLNIGDALGKAESFGFGVIGDDSLPIFVAPRGKPAVGSLRTYTTWNGFPDGDYPDYHYHLEFGHEGGIAADQQHVVKPENLATVHARFATDPKATADQEPFLMVSAVDKATLGDEGHDGIGYPLPPASVNTVYFGTEDGGRFILTGYAGVGVFGGELTTFRGGKEYTADFGRGAIAPAAGTHTGTQRCIACAAGDTLAFGVWPQGDSQHSGDLGNPVDTAHFTLARNGTTIADETGGSGAVVPLVPAGPAVYHAVYDLDLSGVDGVSLSTVTHTDLTVPFDPATAAKLPANDSCEGESATAPCTILPLLTLRSDLLGLDLHNTTTAPFQAMSLDVTHLSYDGVGSKSAIKKVTVSVSFDGGKTWRAATVVGTAGKYKAAWPNNAQAGTTPSIKVTATDAAGGAITQTVSNAYLIGASS